MHPTYSSFFLSGDRKTSPGWLRACDWPACRNEGRASLTSFFIPTLFSAAHSSLRLKQQQLEALTAFEVEVQVGDKCHKSAKEAHFRSPHLTLAASALPPLSIC